MRARPRIASLSRGRLRATRLSPTVLLRVDDARGAHGERSPLVHGRTVIRSDASVALNSVLHCAVFDRYGFAI
jgi:hypothetical protein